MQDSNCNWETHVKRSLPCCRVDGQSGRRVSPSDMGQRDGNRGAAFAGSRLISCIRDMCIIFVFIHPNLILLTGKLVLQAYPNMKTMWNTCPSQHSQDTVPLVSATNLLATNLSPRASSPNIK